MSESIIVPLTRGYGARISPEDAERVLRYSWCAHVIPRKWRSPLVYGKRATQVGGKHVTILLHRFILDAPDGMNVDHIDGDGLNCTRENLRLVTHAQNILNAGPRTTLTSRYKGVYWNKKQRVYMSRIQVDRTCHYLGRFDDPIEAARAYDRAARQLHGQYARLNFPEDET